MAWTNERLTTAMKVSIFFLVLSVGANIYSYLRHNALVNWAASTDDSAVDNYDDGQLTSYLSYLAEKISHHIQQTAEAGHDHASDQHKDPPPPPGW